MFLQGSGHVSFWLASITLASSSFIFMYSICCISASSLSSCKFKASDKTLYLHSLSSQQLCDVRQAQRQLLAQGHWASFTQE